MLGPEKEIIARYVASGQVKLVFWPMLDLGPNSLNAATAVYCVGRQDVDAYWRYHDFLFANQRDVYQADRNYFLQTAIDTGVEPQQFTACFDSAEARAQMEAVDAARRDAGVFNRPTIDVNGQRIFGAQSFSVFDEAIRQQLP